MSNVVIQEQLLTISLLPSPLPTHPKPADRDEVIDWARTILQSKDFVILDTETTGTSNTDEVIQIGIIDADGNVLLDTLVKPEKPRRMPPKAREVHGISMKMLSKAPTFFDLAQTFCSAIESKWIVAYNDAFDMRLLEQTATKYEIRQRGFNFELRSRCAMIAYSQFIGQAGKYDDYAWQRLPRRFQQNHKAVDDCLLTLDLIREVAASPKLDELISVSTWTV